MEHRNNNSGSGFLLGVLVGIAIALLFTTKKGRRILRTITDEGLDKLTNLEDLFEKKMREEDEDDLGLSDYDAKTEMAQPAAPAPVHHAPAPTSPSHPVAMAMEPVAPPPAPVQPPVEPPVVHQEQPLPEVHHHAEEHHPTQPVVVEHHHEHHHHHEVPAHEQTHQQHGHEDRVHVQQDLPEALQDFIEQMSAPTPDFRHEEPVSVQRPQFSHPTSGGRRFFRGIPKRSN